jgi:hypothetical protein
MKFFLETTKFSYFEVFFAKFVFNKLESLLFKYRSDMVWWLEYSTANEEPRGEVKS